MLSIHISLVEKLASITLTPTPFADPYLHYFLCGDLQLNNNMRDQLSIRGLKPLFTTQLDTT